MVIPVMNPWIVQRRKLVGFLVNRGDVSAFEIVAGKTSPGEVDKFSSAAVLCRDNVINLVNVKTEILREKTVLAMPICSIAHLITE
jgi:hypothetical protein